MARAQVTVGGKLDSSFKSTIDAARSHVRGLAQDLSEPLVVIAQGGDRAGTILGWIGSLIVSSVIGPLMSLTIALGGAGAAINLFHRAMGMARIGLEKFATIEDLETAFAPLLGGMALAKQRIAELAAFAATTPFQLPEIAQASRTLEVLTRGALSTGEGLRLVGDVAAQTQRPFQVLAFWIGRAYDALHSGRPAGEALQELQALGVVSAPVRSRIEALQKSGASGAEVWAVLAKELGRTKGSMEVLSRTATGLESTLRDVKDELYREYAASFAQEQKEHLKADIALTQALIPLFRELGAVAGDVSRWWNGLSLAIKRLVASLMEVSGVALATARVMTLMATVVTAVVTASAAQSILRFAMAIRASAAATMMETAAKGFSLAVIRAQTVALAQNLAAKGVNTAASFALAAATTILSQAFAVATGWVRALATALFLNPFTAVIGLITAAATATYFWANSMAEAARKLADIYRAGLEAAKAIDAQRKAMTTVTDKINTLKAAYAALEAQKKAVGSAENDDQRTAAQAGVDLLEGQIRLIKMVGDEELAAGEERAALEKQLREAQDKRYFDIALGETKVMLLKAKLIELLKEERELVEKIAKAEASGDSEAAETARVELGKTRIEKEKQEAAVEEQQKTYETDERTRRVQLAEIEAESEIARLQSEGLSRAESEVEIRKRLIEMKLDEAEAAGEEIEAARLRVDYAKEEERLVKAIESHAERRRQLEAERKGLEVKSVGGQQEEDQREIELAELRRRLDAERGKGEDADSNKVLELENAVLAKERELADAEREREKEKDEAQTAQTEAREKEQFEQLSAEEKAAFLREKQRREFDAASELDRQAANERATGNEAAADEFELKAIQRRTAAEALGFQIEDLLSKSGQARPAVADSLQAIGGGGGIAAVSADPSLVEQRRTNTILQNMLDELRRQNTGGPGLPILQ